MREDTEDFQVKYTHRHPADGNVAIGKLSSQYTETLNNIAVEYLSKIGDLSATTHHTYYTDLTGDLRLNFERIQFADIWQGLRAGAFSEPDGVAKEFYHLLDMNEIYYSNPKPNFTRGPLYGAAANLIPHRDCILFCFPGIRVYRAIICATDGNSDTATEFINHEVERRLNKGDYMVFDFDRTLHQVKKMGQLPTPRILMKLHFLVFNTESSLSSFLLQGQAAKIYIRFASCCYVVYYKVARYTEQLGTDPTTFTGFFFGILWEYPFYPEVRQRTQIVCAGLIANRIRIWASSNHSHHRILFYFVVDILAIYLCIVLWFFLSHHFTNNIFYKKKING